MPLAIILLFIYYLFRKEDDKMSKYDTAKTTWMNPDIEYLFGDEIIEYDMTDAGFNLIRQYKLLPEKDIQMLLSKEKGFERHREIGLMQRDNKVFSDALTSKFAEMRAIFIGVNNIKDDNIISVKKDAIFTIGKCKRQKFGFVEFIPKNLYTSYIRFPSIQNLEIYYSADGKMDIKGMGDSAVNRHRLYMMDFLKNVITMTEDADASYEARVPER